MKLKMLFGTVVSAALAYGVLSLLGFFRETVTPLGMAAGILLTAVYVVAFRAALMRTEKEDVPSREPEMRWKEYREEEKEVLAAA